MPCARVRRFGWLVVPAGLVLLGVLYEHLDGRQEGATGERLSEERFPTDPKLERTLTTWNGPGGRLSPLGVDGLSIDMLIGEREWSEMRQLALVNNFREGDYEALLRFDGGATIRALYRVRGGQSLGDAFKEGTGERLNFYIRLPRSLPFSPQVDLRRFFLQNQADDRYMFQMRTAYVLLEEIGLFHCYNQYVGLTVNGSNVGAYLLVERPENAIRRVYPDVQLIVRRGRHGGPAFSERYRRDGGPRDAHHDRLERAFRELEGEELVTEVERVLDVDGYLRWLAFNSFVRNADIFDEVFFYVVRSRTHPRGALRVMGWDYDDLRAERPAHPQRALKDPLLFAAEDRLDRLVQAEPRLYASFQHIYRGLLEESLTEERLSAVLTQVEEELAPVDLGLPPIRNRRFRARRADRIRGFERWLLARRSELLTVLPTARGRPQSDPGPAPG